MDLIDRQAAIDAADKIVERDTSGNNDVVKAMTAWKMYVETLPSEQPEDTDPQKMIAQYVTAFSAGYDRGKEDAQPEQRWIPVSEKTLPQNGKVVIAKGKTGTWDFGTYRGHGDDIHFWHWKKNTYKRVYWWMYKEGALPEPYREKDNE